MSFVPPLIPPGFPPTTKVDDALAKDQHVLLSEVLRRNGWGGKNSPLNETARGITGCESSDNPEAVNGQPCGPGENAVGLMQVCTVHRGKMGIPKDRDKAVQYLKDPDNNARVARALHRQNGWGPWSCPPVRRKDDPTILVKKTTLSGNIAEAADDAINTVLSPLDVMGDFVGLLGQSSTWFRVGKVYLGGMFIVFGAGALIFVGSRQVAKTAVKFTPAGRLAKKVIPT